MKRLLLLIVVCVAASCSQRVITNISTPLEPLEPMSVKVAYDNIKSPLNAIYIGTIQISDSRYSADCGYDRLITLAKIKVLEAGGNYLHLDPDSQPDSEGSCHRISGHIFRVNDLAENEVEMDMPNESVIVVDTTENEPVLRRIDDSELMFALPSADIPALEPENMFNKVRFALDVVYSHRIVDDIDTPYGFSEWDKYARSLTSGISYGASITSFSSTYCGFGGKFVGSYYSADIGQQETTINTYYIGPEFIARVPTSGFNNAWIFGVSLGYVSYNETNDGGIDTGFYEGGFKGYAELGYDIRLDKGVFMGLKFAASYGAVYAGAFSENNKVSQYAIEIGGGLRF
jgi:hypothetical protein